ncbi:MAG TPA: VanZ family protein [Chitinophagales bacterium]|nr:VanZ family protein [Chitinophagales bacterium]MBP6153609.1 VanZ family protein [Chitinophagales bacterium]HQV77892.1 VanZ family protein [Chitinophagales bacterium]HQW78613.1 VanZ family protein [Chitinophagales bacterium]HRB18793.1 VanZ family protein [Chitinophagales bacterium]
MRNLATLSYKLRNVIPAVLWSGIIFFLCFLPGSAFPKEDWLDKIYFDKIVHAFLYFVLFFLIIRNFSAQTKATIFITSTLCIAQGILIEFIQDSSYIQNRSFDVYDILANIIGVLFSISFRNKICKTS